MANITLMGASYTDVPAVDLPQTGGGTVRFYENGGGSATLIAKTITENGTYSASDDSADGYSSVTVNVPSSATSSWTKVAETSYQVSTTSGTAANVATWATGHSEIWTSNKIVYIRIRDTAGKRAGYFYGSDAFFINSIPINSESTSSTVIGLLKVCYACETDGTYYESSFRGGSGYGVYVTDIYSDGTIIIRRRYTANMQTINGTYKVEVYLLDPAGGVPIFE